MSGTGKSDITIFYHASLIPHSTPSTKVSIIQPTPPAEEFVSRFRIQCWSRDGGERRISRAMRSSWETLLPELCEDVSKWISQKNLPSATLHEKETAWQSYVKSLVEMATDVSGRVSLEVDSLQVSKQFFDILDAKQNSRIAKRSSMITEQSRVMGFNQIMDGEHSPKDDSKRTRFVTKWGRSGSKADSEDTVWREAVTALLRYRAISLLNSIQLTGKRKGYRKMEEDTQFLAKLIDPASTKRTSRSFGQIQTLLPESDDNQTSDAAADPTGWWDILDF